MSEVVREIWGEVSTGWTAAALRAGIILLVGLLLTRLVNRRLKAAPIKSNQAVLLRRLVSGAILGVSIAWALSQLGLDLGVLLGAAGVLTLAIGFASQTSVSNVISGLFLMSERPFVIGDVIKVGNTMGEVLSIDLLSVKLRTFDNLLVRIPNEGLLKTEVINYSHFPIRRYDLQLSVAYKEDLARVRTLLLEVAANHPLCLEEPEPLIIFQAFADSAVTLQFSVWTARANLLQVRNELAEAVKSAFDQAGIEIPFPHRTLYTGAATAPLPVRVVPNEHGTPDESAG